MSAPFRAAAGIGRTVGSASLQDLCWRSATHVNESDAKKVLDPMTVGQLEHSGIQSFY